MKAINLAELKNHTDFDDHEGLWHIHDDRTGLMAYIAIHNTRLGPALGGCRLWPYQSKADAVTDALRLSRGMTHKNALAGLAFGGGKAVIMQTGSIAQRTAAFAAFGRALDRLNSRYITAPDVGVTTPDMDAIATATAHVRGTSQSAIGDPSPFTALGVHEGILATFERRFGKRSVAGAVAAVQGLGSVGYRVAEYLSRAGANLIVSDLNPQAQERARSELGATISPPDTIHAAPADIFVPCALGGGLNPRTIPEIRAGAVAGAANNQLATPHDAYSLMEKGILCAPDFAINAGGVIAVALDGPGLDPDRVRAKVKAIGPTLGRIFERADADDLPPSRIAERMAHERLIAARSRSAA